MIASKSYAHRLLLAAALTAASGGERPEIRLQETNADITATRRVLHAIFARQPVIDCGESGTTLRLCLPVAAALHLRDAFRLTGQGRLMERPMAPLIEALAAHGVTVEKKADGLLCQGKLQPGDYVVAADVSSQYISGLLFALPILAENSTLTLRGQIESRPYIDMTLDVLRRFGIAIEEEQDGRRFLIHGGQQYTCSAQTLEVEGDWSNAAFWLASGAVGGGPVTVTGLQHNSAQGDRRICEILRRFGATVEEGEAGVTCACADGMLHGTEVDVRDIPDLVPALAAVAAHAHGDTRFYHAKRLRLKESDRLQTTAAMLQAVGCQVEVGEDELLVHGRETAWPGGLIDGANDHRIVMAASIVALCCRGPVTIDGAEAVAKSYPKFFEERERLCQVPVEKK